MDIKLNQDSAITVSLRRAEQIDRDSEERFVSLVESAISPAEVSWLFVFQSMKKFVPRWLFVKLLHRASRKTPYIGFMIEPYSLFLFFRLKDLDKARAMLPERYKLIKTSIFADEEPDYYYGLGAFNTRASSFWGARLESYLIAEDRETGLLSFIFIDILSNALIALPAEGIADPNCETALVTLSSRGSIFLNFQDARTRRGLKLRGNIDGGQFRPLDQRLWLTGNTSIAHSDELAAGEEDPFAVLFDPAEVEKALDIPLEDIEISENSLFPGHRRDPARTGGGLPLPPALHRRQPGLSDLCERSLGHAQALRRNGRPGIAAHLLGGPASDIRRRRTAHDGDRSFGFTRSVAVRGVSIGKIAVRRSLNRSATNQS
jgi:hypothetical protein